MTNRVYISLKFFNFAIYLLFYPRYDLKTVHMVDFLGLTKYFRTMLDFKRPLDVWPDPAWTRTRSVTFCQVWQILWTKYYIKYYLKPRYMKQVLQYQYCHICSSFLPHTVLNVIIYRQLITLCHYFIALLIDSIWFYELFIYTWQIHHIYNHSSDIYVFNACSIMCKKMMYINFIKQ